MDVSNFINSDINPPAEQVIQKEAQWAAKKLEVDKIADRLGRGIDSGIKDTVIALNVLGINTSMSCEGHMDHGTGSPYVDITSSDEDYLDKMDEQIRAVYKAAESNGSADARLWDEYHRLRLERDKIVSAEGRRLMPYLDEFYQNRKVAFDKRLVIGRSYHGYRIESQGADFQETAETLERQKKLGEYQEEMRHFTEFLKGKFFGRPVLNRPAPAVLPQPAVGRAA